MRPFNALTKDDKEDIVSLYYEGRPFKEIADILGVSGRSIPRVLKEEDINTRLKNRYTLDESYFEDINTEEKAYWLGFIYADGYVGNDSYNNVVISLKEEDLPHLKKFKKAISYTGGIRNAGKGGFPGSTDRYTINFSNKRMAESLRNLGLYPGKSTTMESFPRIREDLVRHFLRGYFDGDGSVYSVRARAVHKDKLYEYQQLRVTCIGTEPILEQIQSVMPFRYKRVVDSKTPEMKYLEYYGQKEMVDIYKFFFEKASVYLDRKFDKFTSLLGPLEE